MENQFNKEIEILKSLDHPNIIKIYEIFKGKNNIYVVQELIEGKDLLDEINDRVNKLYI
jgi:calcium-dependent protein kinase